MGSEMKIDFYNELYYLDERRENPFLNSVVLLEIFKYLGVKDLKICRQVCRQWRDESLPKLRKCVQIEILNDYEMDEFMKMTALHRIGNYKMNLGNTGRMIISKFLNSPVPLTLREITITGIRYLTESIVTLLSSNQLLESLTLVFHDLFSFRSLLGDPPFPMDQLKQLQFPRLRRLVCASIPRSETEKLFVILMSSPNLSEIVTNDTILTSFLWTRLGIWSGTLESLQIGALVETNQINSKSIPVLNKLKRLKCYGSKFVYPSSSKVPNLEEALFDYTILEDLFPRGLEPTTITSLKIDRPYMRNWTGFTSEMFPYLKIINFPMITNKLFSTVCKNIATLEELHVGSAILDYSITGILRRREQKYKDIVEAAKKPGFDARKHRKYPFVGDLPKLTCFTIFSNSKRLTEASILLGLIYCKSLKSLIIKSQFPEITEATIEALAAGLPQLETLYLRASNLGNIQAAMVVAYLNNKIPNCNVNISSSTTDCPVSNNIVKTEIVLPAVNQLDGV